MRTDRRTDITKLIVTFRSFANAPKNLEEATIFVRISNVKYNYQSVIVKGNDVFGRTLHPTRLPEALSGYSVMKYCLTQAKTTKYNRKVYCYPLQDITEGPDK